MGRFALLALVLVGAFAAEAVAEEPVYFADAQLKLVVEEALGVSNPTPSDMLLLTTYLGDDNHNITSLVGLEYATNLQELIFPHNQITDLSPISGLTNLWELILHNNQITDISAISGLTNLQRLDLEINQITDISVISGMTNLQWLYLYGNQIRDISSLTGLMNLLDLELRSNPLNREAYCIYLPQIADNNPPLEYGEFYFYPNSNPPESVSASDGIYPDRVRITWDALCPGPYHNEVFNYTVYRSTTLSGEKTAISGTMTETHFDDTTASPGVHYWYWVKSDYSQENFSDPDEGWRYSPQRTLTINSTSGGTVSTPGVGSFQYDPGSVVAVVATPEANYHFVNWTGTAVDTGRVADPPLASTTVTVDGDYALVANFAIDQRTLTILAAAGGSIGTPGEGSFTYGHGTSVPIAAIAQANYHFTEWSGTAVDAGKVADPASASTTVIMDSDYTLVANFTFNTYTLTVNATNGSVTATPTKATYTHGETVTLQVTPATGYHFTGWSGDLGGSTNPAMLTMDGNKTVTADFEINTYTLTLNATNGSVTAIPTKATYTHGESVTLQATPATGYHFTGWSGDLGGSTNPATTTMDGNKTITANFEINTYTLTVSATNGSVTAIPTKATYTHGETVTLQATANTGYHFTSWSGDLGGSTNPAMLTMDGNKTVTASFSIILRTLTVTTSSSGSVTTPGVGAFQYDHGSSVPMVATAAANYHFTGWTGTAADTGKVADPSAASTTVTMDLDYTLEANFAINQHTLSVGSDGNGSVTGSGTYDWGSVVPVMATPNANYHFVSWTGTAVDAGKVTDPTVDGTTVTVEADYTLQANFAIEQRTLAVSRTVGGVVTSPGEGSFQYNHGEQATLQAEADPLFEFVGWRGSLFANVNPYSLTMDADYTVKAHFESVLDVLYVDDNAEGDPGPGDPNVSDPRENGTSEHPFDMVQEAIDVAKEGAKVIVRSGTYLETIDLLGKSIEVNGLNTDDPNNVALPIIDGQGKDAVVRCTQREDPNCVLTGLVITGGRGRLAGGILCARSSPSIVNCLIVGNRATEPDGGGGIYCLDSNALFANCTISGNFGGTKGAGLWFKDSKAVVTNSIAWGNTPVEALAAGSTQPVIVYTDVAGGWTGLGNMTAEPFFAEPGYWANPNDLTKAVASSDPVAVWVHGDYHLMSKAGHWDPVTKVWVIDAMTSPCIDTGNPLTPVGAEPMPNGNRINLGVYGGTRQASLSVSP